MPSELKRERDVVEAEVPEMPKKKKSKKEKKNVSSDAAETTAAAASPESESKKEKKKKKKEKKETTSTSTTSTATTVATIPKKSALSTEETTKWYTDNNITLDGVEMTKFAPCLDFSQEQTGFTKKMCDFIRTEKPFFKTPSLIQSTCWPLLMTGRDVFGVAKTGSGKTLAFFLPFLAQSENGNLPISKFNAKAKNKPRMVIVAPTKELAQQTAEVCVEFTKSNVVDGNYPVTCIIGGVPKYQQVQEVKSKGADIVVATSGRLLYVVENDRLLDLSEVQFLVLDEADRMLDMGFIGDMRRLAALCPKEKRQTLLFSATWPAEVNKLARSLIGSPSEKRLKYEVATVTAGRRKHNDDGTTVRESDINCEDPLSLNDAIVQEVKVIENDRVKWDLLMEALNKHGKKKIIIFGLYKKEVARVEQWLLQTGYKVVALQGDMTQEKRTQAIQDFKANKVPMLIATDVAGRGLDIPDVELVINYTMPLTMEDFVHRCGRTGRAGRSGRAISFFNVNGEHCEKDKVFPLIRLLEGARQPVPEKLSLLNKTTFTATKKKAHSVYGNFYIPPEEMAALEKKKVALTFDSDSD